MMIFLLLFLVLVSCFKQSQTQDTETSNNNNNKLSEQQYLNDTKADQRYQQQKQRPDVKSFGIAFVRSSGSTALASWLNAQPNIVTHDEYVGRDVRSLLDVFRVPLKRVEQALRNSGFSRDEIALRWSSLAARRDASCAQLTAKAAKARGAACLDADERERQRRTLVGFKQKIEQLWPSFGRLCSRFGTKLVFLFRQNRIAHTISLLRKKTMIERLQRPGRVVRFEQNHNNQSRTKRTRRWRQRGAHALTNRGETVLPPLTVVFQDFIEQFDELSYNNELLEYHYRSTPELCRMRLNYEDMLSDPENALRQVLLHINGSAEGMKWPLEERVKKTTRRNFTSAITNWRSLQETLQIEEPDLLNDLSIVA